jgi:hypothetical protein
MNRNLQIFNLNMTSAAGGKKSPGSMAGAKEFWNYDAIKSPAGKLQD